MCFPMIYSDKGTYKNNMEFKKMKKNLCNCFLFIKRLITKINTLKFKTILNKELAMIWILLNPKNGFKIISIIKSI